MEEFDTEICKLADMKLEQKALRMSSLGLSPVSPRKAHTALGHHHRNSVFHLSNRDTREQE